MLRNAFAFVALMSFGAGVSSAQTAVPLGEVDGARISETLKGFVDRGELVGVSALVTKDGAEAYFGAFGYADRRAKKPMTRDTIVRIFSMTKPITGTALMQLWEQGRFRLDDPVVKYIPELAEVKVLAGLDAQGKPILVAPERAMTIRDLTRHTAGLSYGDSTDDPTVKAMSAAVDPGALTNTLDELARRLGALPLIYQPGEKWRYSYGVDMQALLVQRLSGEPFEQYVEEHVLKPLGMNHTDWYVPKDERGNLATPYDRNDDGTFTEATHDRELGLNIGRWAATPGGYGLTSTLDDYTRFARMMLSGGELDGVRILRPDTVRLMSTGDLDPATSDRTWLVSDKGEMSFGIDFAVRIDPPKAGGKAGEVGEFFWDGKYNTLFWIDPRNKLTAVLFTQYYPFGKVPLHTDFRAAVYEGVDPAALPPK